MKLKGRSLTLLLTLILVVCGIFGNAQYAQAATQEVVVYVNGEKQSFDVEPKIVNDRTLVPMRKIFETLGANLSWDDKNKRASAQLGDNNMEVTVNSLTAYANGNVILLDSAPIIRNNRTLVPLRFISESLGAKVNWNAAKREVRIDQIASILPIEDENAARAQGEENAMWISFLEYMQMPKNEAGFKREFIKMLDNSKALGMNSVIAHVRSHSDAMYPSDIYPWSKHLTGTQGKNPGYDPLQFMIEETHKRGMKFHAWINPYRVSSYGTYFNETSSKSPAKRWLSDSDSENDRWVLKHKGDYYLNPSVQEVKNMVIAGVVEVVKNYDVDGIHFDDYFYPRVDDGKAELSFDLPEYQASGTQKSIVNFRKDNVNDLVKGVYAAIKAEKTDVLFGISPAGNLENLRSNNAHFVDIERWLTEDGYVDYIMPQLYWGFEAKQGGKPAKYAYEANLKAWKNLVKNPRVKLYVGLDMANAGLDIKDGNSVSEWKRNNDIIARQVKMGRKYGVSGFAYFRYASFENKEAASEVENLKKVLK